jgi:hypothetical protein
VHKWLTVGVFSCEYQSSLEVVGLRDRFAAPNIACHRKRGEPSYHRNGARAQDLSTGRTHVMAGSGLASRVAAVLPCKAGTQCRCVRRVPAGWASSVSTLDRLAVWHEGLLDTTVGGIGEVESRDRGASSRR